MADLDDIKDGKDFGLDRPQQNVPFTLKAAARWTGGCSRGWRASLTRKATAR
jgi:hypothetical protein